MKKINGFVAYSSGLYVVKEAIATAIAEIKRYHGNEMQTWEENEICGRPLTDPIFSNIDSSGILIADISRLNFNVTFEIGYAIGSGKRVHLIKSEEIKNQNELIDKIGIFDTLGYEPYSNSKDLGHYLRSLSDEGAIPISHPFNRAAPVYLIETPIRGEMMTHLIARIKKARLFYRSFTPSEESRLSAIDAIKHVASSFGVVVPLADPSTTDATIHNIRAAFVAGLAKGMNKPNIILQSRSGPVPLDVRNFTVSFSALKDIDKIIHDFSLDVFEEIQKIEDIQLPEGNFLAQITMGDPMAENELQTLGGYYLQTNEFHRALRGEVNLVVGRKGTGKTALFSQVRNSKRKVKQNVMVDLKPEGYQLIKLKEEVLDLLSEGAKAHLITAFWEYLLYLEVCYKIMINDRERQQRDEDLHGVYENLSRFYGSNHRLGAGDFSERLLYLSDRLIEEYTKTHSDSKDVRLTTDEVTKLLHLNQLHDLQNALSDYLNYKEEVWVLFDNLDKGWSSNGLAKGDIVILRCLIDASRKIQRTMRKAGHEFFSIVFVRNDVYQLLMDSTPDFGKETRASLDWSDPDLLREVLRKRLIYNELDQNLQFEQIWSKVCISHYNGEETSQYLIDRALMRPRNLLRLFSSARGFAVNLQHAIIEESDIEKGVKAYSTDLLVDADQELSDIEPSAKRLIYEFLGETQFFTLEDLNLILELHCIEQSKWDKIIEFLLYYGFFGIKYMNEDPLYIHNVGYDMEILRTRIKKNKGATTFYLNPAFWPALQIQVQGV